MFLIIFKCRITNKNLKCINFFFLISFKFVGNPVLKIQSKIQFIHKNSGIKKIKLLFQKQINEFLNKLKKIH